MVMSNLIHTVILPTSQWHLNVANKNMFEGDGFYELIDLETRNQQGVFSIDEHGYLEIKQ